MTTPHNQAEQSDIANIVLMPGDPLRAKFIADQYLEDVKQFNSIRNMLGYTGTYKDKRISVMGSGMGMPSIGIYSYELFKFYNVDYILRIGSAGAYTDSLQLFDLVLADHAWSESTYALAQSGDKRNLQYPDASFNQCIEKTAEELGYPIIKAPIHSSDVFYHENHVDDHTAFYAKYGCVCVEMESFALFHNAAILDKHAACLLTISDSLVTHQITSADQRQSAFQQMMKVALETAIKMV